MSKAIKKLQWRGVATAEVLERRTYKSGFSRWFVKGSAAWVRINEVLALQWIEKKRFVFDDEYKKIKWDDNQNLVMRINLIRAQQIGGSAKWERRQ